MTDPSDRIEQRGDDAELARVRNAVRAASGPALDDGAARRIADGAWQRAQNDSTSAASSRRRSRRMSPTVRRWSIAAAALVTVGIGAFAIRPTEPAFAIDGDPVQVLAGDRWVSETRRVRPGATVFVADGATILRAPGAEIVPQAGATFRIVGEDGQRFRIEILGGAAEVSGDAVQIALADIDVEPAPRQGTVCMFASVPPVVEGLPTSQLAATSARLSAARVEVRLGEAFVRRASTGESLALSSTDRAAFLPVSTSGPRAFRIGRLHRYTPQVAMRIATGHPVIEMQRTGTETIAVLGGPDDRVMGFTIEGDQLPAALDQMNSAMLTLVAELDQMRIDVDVRSEILEWRGSQAPLEVMAIEQREKVTELVHTVHGVEHRVIVSGDGTVVVEHVGGDSVTYPSLDSAREEDPDAVTPLERFLEND